MNNATEKHWVERFVSEIKIHQNYSDDAEYKKSNGDIAVLVMEKPVTFSNYIRPICLPDPSEKVFNVDGVVVGRGRRNLSSRGTSPIPSLIYLHSISLTECLLSNEESLYIVSKNSFCAVNEHQALCQGFLT